MGRPPSNGVPAFRFNSTEVAEMETILQAHNAQMPSREVLDALAEKFSTSAERSGKFVVQVKQIWNWFQNRRYAIRAKAGKPAVKLAVSTPLNNSTTTTTPTKNVPPPPQLVPCSTATMRSVPQNTQTTAAPPVQDAVRNVAESQMEFEARSARDGAWYDVTSFISHRSVETGDPEVLVRFAGFGPEEDEWVNVRKHIRQRSLPCESAECIVVLPGDLILCFQEGKEQALYYDAHILDSQRRRHDIRGCRCRFLVRYDHDQSEEIVPLRKICRRPETDHRLQQLDVESGKVNQEKTGVYAQSNNSTKVCPPTKMAQKEQNQTADNRANDNVALHDSQPLSGCHSVHIRNVNINSELTHSMPPAKDSISTQVRPAAKSHAAVEATANQISESTQPPAADTVAIQPPVSDTVVTQMLPSPDSHAAGVVKVSQTSEVTQLPPLEETNSNTVATRMLPALENHAAVVAEAASTQNSLTVPSQSKAPLEDSNSNTVETLVLPAPEVAAASTQNSLPVPSQSKAPLEDTNSNTVETLVLPVPENHAAVAAVSASTQNSLPVSSQSEVLPTVS